MPFCTARIFWHQLATTIVWLNLVYTYIYIYVRNVGLVLNSGLKMGGGKSAIMTQVSNTLLYSSHIATLVTIYCCYNYGSHLAQQASQHIIITVYIVISTCLKIFYQKLHPLILLVIKLIGTVALIYKSIKIGHFKGYISAWLKLLDHLVIKDSACFYHIESITQQ